jgi:Sulfotransferase domain
MRLFRRKSKSIPICIFCYHKAGTVLLGKVFRQICETNNLEFKSLKGKQTEIPPDTDVILFAHSLIDFTHVEKPFVGVHVIRDPRDIIVSGYHYHRQTTEKWCINTDFSTTPPIRFPKVPYSQEHRSEEWKIKYLESLGGISYQENLLRMSQQQGLMFEMNNYGAWTIESMKDWNYGMGNILEIRFENLTNRYDDTFRRIFDHIGFSKSESAVGLKIAALHDLGRKSPEEIEKMRHITSPSGTNWEEYFETQHKEAFLDRFGDVLVRLGYETSNNW